MKNLKVIIFCLLYVQTGFGQDAFSFRISGKNLYEIQHQTFEFIHFEIFPYQLSFHFPIASSILKKENPSFKCDKYQGQAAKAFFCKMEDKLEKKVNLPVRMRLGNLEYVDQLEQKRTYRYSDWIMDNSIE